jgi:eukaryotic-like serine/threonine-protein kinase
MTFWRKLIHEMHRRSIWQVIGIYVVGAWIALQVILALHASLALPDWVPPLAIVLFMIGLPIVVATAFVQEGPPTRDSLAPRRAAAADPTLLPGLEVTTAADDAVAATSAHGAAALDGAALDAAALDAAARADGTTAAPAAASGLHAVLTWRRALLAGVVAFLLLAMTAVGFRTARERGTLLAQGVMEASDVIVLADFRSTGADPTLGEVVTEALRIDLVRSPVIRLAEPSRIAAVLARMQREGTGRLDAGLAHEVAVREGLKAVLAGEVGVLGGGYVLSAELRAAADGSVLAGFRAVARDSTQLIDAVDELSRQVRDRVGESLRALRASPPLAEVTTSSLPALRKYAEASRIFEERSDGFLAATILGEAVALDSTFAMAWRKLGVVLGNMGVRLAERNDAVTRAYELRERLPEAERLHATALYEMHVAGNRAAAIETYRRLVTLDPDDLAAVNNLSLNLMNAERYEEAEPLLERAAQTGRASDVVWVNLFATQYRLGRVEAAESTLAAARRAYPENPGIERRGVWLAAAQQRWDVLDSMLAAHAARFRGNPSAQAFALLDRREVALLEGRLADEAAHVRELRRIATAENLRVQLRLTTLGEADVALRVLGDRQRGLRLLEQAEREYPRESFEPRDRPYEFEAVLFADAGLAEQADALLEEAARVLPRPVDADDEFLSWSRAYVALRRGDPAPGLERFRVASSRPEPGACRICDLPLLGQAYELAGQPDSARAVYERFLTLPHLYRLSTDPVWRPIVLQRVAELHEAAGDTARAIERYAEFLSLWARADPVLRPRLDAARQRLEALRGRG